MTDSPSPYIPPADLKTHAQFVRFVVVGGTGVVVNLIAVKLLLLTFGDSHKNDAVWAIFGSDYHVRNYHLFAIAAFVVANISNYILNRVWTFRSHGVTDWRSEYLPFLVIGVAAQALGLLILTGFQHPDSPVHIASLVIAQALTIIIVTPINFVGNKAWTFRAAQQHRRDGGGIIPPPSAPPLTP
ncbi:MAG: GtrA family protein [Thermoleophilia bacterium]|nr:GtrA family protein [Thermoleophilia bacterium]